MGICFCFFYITEVGLNFCSLVFNYKGEINEMREIPLSSALVTSQSLQSLHSFHVN